MFILFLFYKAIDHETKQFLKKSPNLPVLICGTVPNGQVALFAGDKEGNKCCLVPYCSKTRQDGTTQPIQRKRDKVKGKQMNILVLSLNTDVKQTRHMERLIQAENKI
jgi:hypothetical protein